MRELNRKGLNLIKKFEGTVPFVYLCQAEYPTIGCGHLCRNGDFYLKNLTIGQIEESLLSNHEMIKVDNYFVKSNSEVKEYTTISDKQIDLLLKNDLGAACNAVESIIEINLNDNQFAALVSFTFNLGGDALQRSTLRRKLNQGRYKEVPTELNKWVYAGGERLDGLVKRRAAEGKLFLTNPMLV